MPPGRPTNRSETKSEKEIRKESNYPGRLGCCLCARRPGCPRRRLPLLRLTMQLSPRGRSHPRCLARSDPCAHRCPRPSSRIQTKSAQLPTPPGIAASPPRVELMRPPPAHAKPVDRANGDELGLGKTRGGRRGSIEKIGRRARRQAA